MKSVLCQLAGAVLFAALLGLFYKFIAGSKAVVWWVLIATVALIVGFLLWLWTSYRPTFEVARNSTGATAPPVVATDLLTTFAVVAGVVVLILFGARRLARAFA